MSAKVQERPKVVSAFDDLTAAERTEIARFVTPFTAGTGTVLFRQDTPEDRMYLLTKGLVEQVTNLPDGSNSVPLTSGAGESLGESVPGDSPGYLATAKVVEDAAGFAINVERFRELRRRYSPIAFKVLYRLALGLCTAVRNLDAEIAARPARRPGTPVEQAPGLAGRVHALSQGCVGFLRRMPFFEAFEDTELDALCKSMRQWDVSKDQLLFTEGEPSASCFILIKGQVGVTVERHGHIVTLADLGPGRIFGEISLLDQGARSATCRVLKDCELLEIGAGEFTRLFNDGSKASFKLLEAVHWNLLGVQRALLAERTGLQRDGVWVLV